MRANPGQNEAELHLRALPGGSPADAPTIDECRISRVAGRTGDRHDPWTLKASEPVRVLARGAAARGVDLELAVRLTVEHALVRRDLIAIGVDAGTVDLVAHAARVSDRLDASAATYLRRLTHPRDGVRSNLGDSITVGLPLRLTARLLAVSIETLIREADLDRAIAWEVAAVVAGRTMSEWAPLAALSAGASARSSR